MNRSMVGRNDSLVQGWATLAGIVLILTGLLGFIQNPIAYSRDAILIVDNVHNIVHLLTGALALGIAFGTKGEQQVNAVLGFGILYVGIFVLNLVSPNLFGLFSVPANTPIHVVHAAVAVVSLGVGYMARTAATAR